MKLKTIKATASAILFAGAVLFSCHPRTESGSIDTDTNTFVQQPLAADTVSVATSNSPTPIGHTGYALLLPPDYILDALGDSSFLAYPTDGDVACPQSIKISFGEKELKVPGTRPVISMPATLLGKAVSFTDFSGKGPPCRMRTGGARLDSLYVQITCAAAEGEAMERLFAIALSLKKITN